ncbi:MAG: RICIN domain-containing protein [Burkholderiaceae bacterium]
MNRQTTIAGGLARRQIVVAHGICVNLHAGLISLLLISSCATVAQSDGQVASLSAASHLRLIDRLDRPQDGYCIDVLGTNNNLRLNLPVFAHNCKTTLTSDSAVVFDSTGQITLPAAPAANRCLTVAGVNGAALPGAAVMLRRCGEAVAYFDASDLQRFSHRNDGLLELKGSGLCLTVGAQSATTYSSQDRWRTLFVDECRRVVPAHSHWEFVKPGS